MEEGATISSIWYVVVFLKGYLINDRHELKVMTHAQLSICFVVFKTAVVFVCKDGSKQKKKMVGFLTGKSH